MSTRIIIAVALAMLAIGAAVMAINYRNSYAKATAQA
jgi:hypothetical protein